MLPLGSRYSPALQERAVVTVDDVDVAVEENVGIVVMVEMHPEQSVLEVSQ